MACTVSVITAAYNAQNHIAHMIESVIQQPASLELIIVDDGSKDETFKLCQKYEGIDRNIRVISTENRGAGAARNTGIEAATGEYLMFLDSDDLFLADSIHSGFLMYLEECCRSEVDIICTARSKTDMKLNRNPIITFPEKLNEIRGDIPRLEFWTCIYRRQFLMDNHIRFFTYREQDVESAFRFRAFSNARFVEIQPQYSFYLQRDNLNSNVHTSSPLKVANVKARIYGELLSELSESMKQKNDDVYLYITYVHSFFAFAKAYHQLEQLTTKDLERYQEMRQLFKNRHPFPYLKSLKVLPVDTVKCLIKVIAMHLFFLNRKNRNIEISDIADNGPAFHAVPLPDFSTIEDQWKQMSMFIQKNLASQKG